MRGESAETSRSDPARALLSGLSLAKYCISYSSVLALSVCVCIVLFPLASKPLSGRG